MRHCINILVTGGIATGKSTFCKLLLEHLPGTVVFDCDSCVHELLTSPEVVGRITASLGKDLQSSDGSLDRTRTSALVFQNTGKRRILEEIIHPLVRRACEQARQLAEDQSRIRFFVADVPLFYESGFPFDADLQIVIACGPRTQRSRLQARSPNHDPSHLDSRLAAQLPILEKISRASTVLWNGGSPEALSAQTLSFISWLNQKFPPPPLLRR